MRPKIQQREINLAPLFELLIYANLTVFFNAKNVVFSHQAVNSSDPNAWQIAR
jgi:hypothetical protein